ncbi:MAG: class I SAM-dependent methyltransferase, partial [Chloroflexi bacterium]
SGRLLIPLALDGYTITGVDGSEKMLSLARERVQQANLTSRVTLVQQDMSALQLSQKFSFAFVALGSFAHLT